MRYTKRIYPVRCHKQMLAHNSRMSSLDKLTSKSEAKEFTVYSSYSSPIPVVDLNRSAEKSSKFGLLLFRILEWKQNVKQ